MYNGFQVHHMGWWQNCRLNSDQQYQTGPPHQQDTFGRYQQTNQQSAHCFDRKSTVGLSQSTKFICFRGRMVLYGTELYLQEQTNILMKFSQQTNVTLWYATFVTVFTMSILNFVPEFLKVKLFLFNSKLSFAIFFIIGLEWRFTTQLLLSFFSEK